MVALLVILAWDVPFAVRPDGAVLPGLGVGVLTAIAIAGRGGGKPRLAAAGTAFLQLTLFTLLAVALSYMLAARGGVLWDSRLAAWDRALGIDWAVIRRVVDASGALAWLLGAVYWCLVPQMIVAVVALSFRSCFERLRVTVTAAILSGFATTLLSGSMPAAGNLFDPGQYRHLWTPVALAQAPLIEGLRDGSMRVIDLGAMQGIVTFPSYHAALAAIFVYAFRAIPGLALPGTLWAGLTMAATPLGGGHYAVDVIAGVALALVSLPIAEALVRFGAVRTAEPSPTGLVAAGIRR